MQVAQDIYRLGTRLVNWYLVVTDEGITVVDCGLPRYFDQLPRALDSIGASMEDLTAVILTHNHSDHLGAAPRLIESQGLFPLIHELDAPTLRGDAPAKGLPGVLSVAWRPTMARFLIHVVANGGAKPPKLEVSTFRDEEVLDVPGKPVVVPTPGHTPGHCCFLFEDRKVLFTGDALVMRDSTRGRPGASLHTLNEDRDRAAESLARIENLDVDLILSGHGEPFRGSVKDAVRLAREDS